jgi:DNA-binding PadR family transcriptional regulator
VTVSYTSRIDLCVATGGPAIGEPLDKGSLTDFEQILLGLLARNPRSGYELKRFFATTPAVAYQPSSGTVYPALRRLEQRGLLSGTDTPSAGRRTQRRYRPTPAGHTAHLGWLRQPVESDTIARDLGVHLMRFVMAERVLAPAEILGFLRDLAGALDSFIADTERYVEATPLPGRHPHLALRHGLDVHRASLAWVGTAIETITAEFDAHSRGALRPDAIGHDH